MTSRRRAGWGWIVTRALLVMLVALMACSGERGRSHELSKLPSPPLPAPSPPLPAPRAASPCELAAELRARVPRLMEEGKLHRTAGVLEKANRLCPATAKETWVAELEAAVELGKYAEARALMQRVGSAPDAPEAAKQAAKAAAEKVERFDKPWPGPEAVTAEMRKPYELAETAAAENKLAEAMALYQQAWEAWPLNGQALVSAGFAARALGKPAEAQRLFDRAIAMLERRVNKTVKVDVPNGFSGLVTSVAWSRDGKRLAVAHGTAVTILDTATWRERVVLLGHTDGVSAVAFSPDGQQLASGSGDTTVRLWDAATGAARRTLKGHTGEVLAVAFSPNGKQLASGSRDTTVRRWDAATGAARRTLKGHTGEVLAVAFSPDGQQLASGSEDATVRLWDAATGEPRQRLTGHTSAVRAMAFSPNGQRLAAESLDETVRLWEAATGAGLRTLKGHTAGVNAVAFSPDGKYLASGSWDKTVWLWDAATGAQRRKLEGHTDGVNTVAFSPSNALLASASQDGSILLWHLPDGAVAATLRAIATNDASYLFTPTGHIDFMGNDPCAARALAVCRIGPYSLPFEVCEERAYARGLLTNILADDSSYLEPEAESPPLTCAASTP